MSQNPYAPPTAAPERFQRGTEPGGGQIDIGEAMTEAWQLMTENWALAIGASILYMLLTLGAVVTCVGIFLLLPVLVWGFSALLLNIVDGDPDVGDLFSGFNEYGSALPSMLLYMVGQWFLTSFLPSFFAGFISGFAQIENAEILTFLIGMVIGLPIYVRLAFAPFYIVDQDMGGIEAMQTSWAVTADQWMTGMLLAVISCLLFITGAIALGIGWLFTVPLTYLLWTVAYRQIEPPLEEEPVAPHQAYAATTAPRY